MSKRGRSPPPPADPVLPLAQAEEEEEEDSPGELLWELLQGPVPEQATFETQRRLGITAHRLALTWRNQVRELPLAIAVRARGHLHSVPNLTRLVIHPLFFGDHALDEHVNDDADIAKLVHLTTLIFATTNRGYNSHSRVTPAAFLTLPRLTYLDFGTGYLLESEYGAITGLSNLRVLRANLLHWQPAAFQSLTNLVALSFGDSGSFSHDVPPLLRYLTNLVHLEVPGFDISGYDLAPLVNLTYLDVRDTGIVDASIAPLTKLRLLMADGISPGGMNDSFTRDAFLPHPQLSMVYWRICSTGAIDACHALRAPAPFVVYGEPWRDSHEMRTAVTRSFWMFAERAGIKRFFLHEEGIEKADEEYHKEQGW